MTNEILYRHIISELPDLETIRDIYGLSDELWASILLAVYRLGRVEQLQEWCAVRTDP